MAIALPVIPDARIQTALRRASAATGTDFDYLVRTAARESAFKSNAKSKSSSATGLFQFIEETWLATLKRVGSTFGLGKLADAIEKTPGGRYKVPDSRLRGEILALRKDPETSALLAGALTRQSSKFLEGRLGRRPVSGELYMAHFLGPAGALRMIGAAEKTPHADASRLFPKAAAANRAIFYDRSGRARSVKQVYANLIAKHGTARLAFGPGGAGQASAVPVAAAAGERAVTNIARKADQRPLLHRLFVTSFEGAGAKAAGPGAPGVTLSPEALKVLASAGGQPPAKKVAARPVRSSWPVPGPARQDGGLLQGPRLRGLNGTLTLELFRTIGLRGSA